MDRRFGVIGNDNGNDSVRGPRRSRSLPNRDWERAIQIENRQGFGDPCDYGFGYDESADDYKIVEVSIVKKVNIYSLKTGKWNKLGGFSCVVLLNGCGKFSNGALHWVMLDSSNRWRIVSLDLAKETYGEVFQPEYDGKGHNALTLGVLGELLCVLCNYRESRVVDVWVMKVYGVMDSWTKVACIPYPADIWWDQILDPLCISIDGKVLLKFGSKLLVYNSKDSSSTMIDNFDRRRQVCILVESLVSPFPPLCPADNNDDEN
ncbi:F-box associated domain containing protein [Tanacetum coccineum]